MTSLLTGGTRPCSPCPVGAAETAGSRGARVSVAAEKNANGLRIHPGERPPTPSPRQSSTARPCAAAHLPIATYDVAPVRHAHAPIASTPVNSCRRSRRRRASGTAANAAASDEVAADHRPRGRRRASRSDGRAGQRAAPQAPGRRPRGQGKMPSRVRALAVRTSGSAPSSSDETARARPIRLRPRVGADHRHQHDFADALGRDLVPCARSPLVYQWRRPNLLGGDVVSRRVSALVPRRLTSHPHATNLEATQP